MGIDYTLRALAVLFLSCALMSEGSNGAQLLNNMTIHRAESIITGALTFLQEDITRPGTFLGIQGKAVIAFSDNSSVMNLTPQYSYSGITSLYQLNDSILVVDSNANCIVQINRTDCSVSTHSGKCERAPSTIVDGPFLKARYDYPYDLASRAGNITHIYVLDDNSLRLINQNTQSVTTLFEGYWFLDRLGFLDNDIIICSEGGIQLIDGTSYSDKGLIQFNFNATKTEDNIGQKDIKPYSFNSFAIISSSHIIAYRNTYYDYVSLLEHVVLLDIEQRKMRVICGKGSEAQPFCEGHYLIPDYVTMIDERLYITTPESARFNIGSASRIENSNSSITFVTLNIQRFCGNEGQSYRIGSKLHIAVGSATVLHECYLDIDKFDVSWIPINNISSSAAGRVDNKSHTKEEYIVPLICVVALISVSLVAVVFGVRRKRQQAGRCSISQQRAPPHAPLPAPEPGARLMFNTHTIISGSQSVSAQNKRQGENPYEILDDGDYATIPEEGDNYQNYQAAVELQDFTNQRVQPCSDNRIIYVENSTYVRV